MRYLYTFLFYLALPFLFIRLLWRSRRLSANRTRWLERLGFGKPLAEKSIWIHLASVGETVAAAPLIKLLQQHYPTIPIVVTNMTMTGAARTASLFNGGVLQTLIPYDVPSAIKRFFKRANPIIAIFFETELWPNTIRLCEEHAIPVVISNARLSEKSARGYQRVRKLIKPMLNAVRTCTVQSETEKKRFINLGLAEERITITGNIKFDVEVPADLEQKKNLLREELGAKRFIWIAASTHPTEEEIILQTHKTILKKFPDALLILVPRHPDRFNQVHALILQANLNVLRRTQKESISLQTEVYLADTMGEMLLLYAVSDVAFIGGSFANIGGHNMLEAAVLGKPVITGPILHNFKQISRNLMSAGGMEIVNDPVFLAEKIIALFSNEQKRNEMGTAGAKFVAANRGALDKQFNVLKTILSQ